MPGGQKPSFTSVLSISYTGLGRCLQIEQTGLIQEVLYEVFITFLATISATPARALYRLPDFMLFTHPLICRASIPLGGSTTHGCDCVWLHKTAQCLQWACVLYLQMQSHLPLSPAL